MDIRDTDHPLIADYSDINDHYGELIDTTASKPTIVRASATSIIDAIQRYLDDVQSGHEYTPDQIGQERGSRRRSILNSALALALAKAARRCERNSTFIGPILLYVSINSDNQHGRCTAGAKRISEYAGCGEDVFRDLRDALVTCGALRAERSSDRAERRRTGKSVPVWLPYVAEAVLHSDFAIMNEMAPPRLAGRPRKTSGITCPTITGKTSGVIDPTVSEKRRVFEAEGSGIGGENVGHLTPDTNNSIQNLTAGMQDGFGSVFGTEQISDWHRLLNGRETLSIDNLLIDELNAAWPLCQNDAGVLRAAALATLAEAKRNRPSSPQGFIRTVLRSQIQKVLAAKTATSSPGPKRRLTRWG